MIRSIKLLCNFTVTYLGNVLYESGVIQCAEDLLHQYLSILLKVCPSEFITQCLLEEMNVWPELHDKSKNVKTQHQTSIDVVTARVRSTITCEQL